MRAAYIGIDNGVTGWIAVIMNGFLNSIIPTPVKRQRDYTVQEKFITRVDFSLLSAMLQGIKAKAKDDLMVVMEKPYTGSGASGVHVKPMLSGARAFESTLVAVEQAGIDYHVVPSITWQSKMLPKKAKGEEKKQAAFYTAKSLFDDYEGEYPVQAADAIIMAEWARQREL